MHSPTTYYRGYTIEPNSVGYGYDYYETACGVDCEWTGDGWKSNVRNASTIKSAKSAIDDKLFERTYEVRQGRIVLKFDWLSDCVKFLTENSKAELLTEIY